MGFQMLKEMELQCNSLWLVRARANREQTDGKLAEKAGRLAPAIHKEQNTFSVSQYPQGGFISHPEFDKQPRMFGAGLSVALDFCVVVYPDAKSRGRLNAITARRTGLLCLHPY